MEEVFPDLTKGPYVPRSGTFYRDKQGFVVIEAKLEDDDLTIVHPETGEERFNITDGAIADLRPHEHEWAPEGICTVCHRSKEQVKEQELEQ